MLSLIFELPAVLQRFPHPRDGKVRVSDRFADVPVFNQFGARFRFHRDFVGGRILVLTSMYTECRGTCPTTNLVLQKLREQLSAPLGERLVFISLSLDPEKDHPGKLREYAGRYEADIPSSSLCPWHFLTGKKADFQALRRSLGMFDLNPGVDGDISRHEATILFGNCDLDRWASLPAQLRYPLLVEAIRRVTGFTQEQRFGFRL